LMLVGSCAQCGAPATLRCTICGRTYCHKCLDSDERRCADCQAMLKQQRGIPTPGHPPSRKITPRPPLS
jgi:hypothetical protein